MKGRAGTLAIAVFWIAGAISYAQTIPQPVKTQHAKQYPEYHTGINIVNEVNAGRDVDKEIELLPPLYAFDPSENVADYPEHELRSLACDADVIVVGSAKAAETGVTQSGDFLFTDYTFSVASVIKANDSNPAVGSTIIVTRPGGATRINGHFVKTSVGNFPQFDLHQQYLLFLRLLPATNTYRAYRSGTFAIAPNGSVAPIDSAQKITAKSTKRKDAFLTEVRAAATAPCGGITRTLN
jgi:hypothetical protein